MRTMYLMPGRPETVSARVRAPPSVPDAAARERNNVSLAPVTSDNHTERFMSPRTSFSTRSTRASCGRRSTRT
jgi:hypothetical protein